MKQPSSLSYKSAGVDIDAGNALVERIKAMVKGTHGPEVIGGIGGFGALFSLGLESCSDPVLVSGTDGVGTKLRLAIDTQRHDTIGIDLVAMCVNDILTLGARPLFFLDYFATGRLDVETAADVIKGIVEGCRQANTALIGGETAEMPGMYQTDDYDLAGFSVGLVDRSKIIDGTSIRAGQTIIGLASSGPHSNGYSLIRQCLAVSGASGETILPDGQRLIDALLKPTFIYVNPVLRLLKHYTIHGMAHITGGGVVENIPRVIPDDLCARINPKSWPRPAVFDWIQEAGQIDHTEMWRTFNCGIGMVLIVDKTEGDNILADLRNLKINAWTIGTIAPCEGPATVELV